MSGILMGTMRWETANNNSIFKTNQMKNKLALDSLLQKITFVLFGDFICFERLVRFSSTNFVRKNRNIQLACCWYAANMFHDWICWNQFIRLHDFFREKWKDWRFGFYVQHQSLFSSNSHRHYFSWLGWIWRQFLFTNRTFKRQLQEFSKVDNSVAE